MTLFTLTSINVNYWVVEKMKFTLNVSAFISEQNFESPNFFLSLWVKLSIHILIQCLVKS